MFAIEVSGVVLVVSAFAVILLLLTAMVDPPAGGGPGLPATLLEQPDTQPWPPPRRVQQAGPDPRRPWLAQSGAAAVDNVPTEVQTEALAILNSLRALDVYFTDDPHPPRCAGS